jgi:hypothetical protein
VILMLIAQLIFLFNIFYSLGKSRKLTSWNFYLVAGVSLSCNVAAPCIA